MIVILATCYILTTELVRMVRHSKAAFIMSVVKQVYCILIPVTCQSFNPCGHGAECTMVDDDHYQCDCPLGEMCLGNCSGVFSSYDSDMEQLTMCEGMLPNTVWLFVLLLLSVFVYTIQTAIDNH